ncbi:hypothetical protein M1373_00220 [Candidatus Marsarchaeota archaeon]|nr:hypothetical protein [Candidatus Marsarchaeota archaeon]
MEGSAIAIDLDDTIADTSAIALEIIRNEYLPSATLGKWKYFSIKESFGIDDDEAEKIFKRVWDYPKQVKLVDPSIPGIVDALRSRHKVYLVTATRGEESNFAPWLKSKGIGFDKILHVGHSLEKALLSRRYGIGFYIDDHIVVAESVAAAGKTALLLKKSWNSAFFNSDKTKGIIKMRNWKEVSDFFKVSKGN